MPEVSALSWNIGAFGLHGWFYENRRPRQHTTSLTLPSRGTFGKPAAAVYLTQTNTTGSVLAHHAQRGGSHVSLEVLAPLGATIAAVIALAHAYVPLLVRFPLEVSATNERRRCTQGFNTPPVKS